MKSGLSGTLQGILRGTETEISRDRSNTSLKRLRQMIKDAPRVLSFRNSLSSGNAVIAEIKEQSPSQGKMLTRNFNDAPRAYFESPLVKAVSVLTNRTYFGRKMKLEFLQHVKEYTRKPVLRKDFITTEYQVYQARAYGADAILLMANILERDELRRLSDFSFELGMDVLFETHSVRELEDVPDTARIVGINCRNFDAGQLSFGGFGFARFVRQWLVNQDRSVNTARFGYADQLPGHVVKVAESGVTAGNCADVFAFGFQAVLVGTSFLMDERGIEAALKAFASQLRGAQVGSKKGKQSKEPEKELEPDLAAVGA